MPDKRIRRKNTLLFIVLLASMAISCLVTIRRLENESAPVSLPVSLINTSVASIDVLKQEVMAEKDSDLAALREITQNELLDDATREAAAVQLASMIDRQEKQSALEKALSSTTLAPCTVVLTEGSATVITGKDTLTPAESAMVITLAVSHAGIDPDGVRVITGMGK